ncbi:PQQ-binding-like beta-propeller repeat protein [Amycolatopsis carbonis]|uniref:PQQ-binding-like beta-propeller repeat protein n=1 Tax=Amycolatopsis carbonis TaxID=715471 RepID=A0A9Y2IP78_9PSEU|nr:PQQ-binding-like beta-propeller repeat protein [Amycolatopsis sp. 2-15]WIX82984.1 PQQ-binding-like beta-propeller repeat protein [Amycolatopsis sp. 2-15]
MFELRWERPLHQRPSIHDFAVADGDVLVHERSTRLVRLAGSDGTVHWDVPLGTWPRAVVVDGTDVFALPQLPSRLFCLSWPTGEPRWTRDVGWPSGHVVASPNLVLVGGWRGYTPLRALDRTTGELRWTRSGSTVRPAWFAGGFLVGKPGGRLVELLRPATGAVERAWWAHVPDPDAGPVFEVSGSSAVVGGRALDPTSWRTHPAPAAAFPRPTSVERLVGSVAVAGGLVTLDNAGHLEHWAADGTRLTRTRVAGRAVGLHILAPGRIAVAGKGTVAVYDIG